MVTKRKCRKISLEFLPQTPDLEAIPSHFDIMKKHHSTRPEFWKPGIDIMGDSIIGMQAVNMKHVKAAILKQGRGLIEGHSKEFGKGFVVFVVVLCYVRKYFLAIQTSLFVSL